METSTIVTVGLFLLTHLIALVGVAHRLFSKVDRALEQIDNNAKQLREHEKRDEERDERIHAALEKSISFMEARHKYALDVIDKQHRVALDGIRASNQSSKERFDMAMKAIEQLASRTDVGFGRVHTDIAQLRENQAQLALKVSA